jgi:hypothetical protein
MKGNNEISRMYKLYMYKCLKRKNGNANAIINVMYEIKRDLYTKYYPTNVKQVSKHLKLLKRISRKRKIFFRLFIYFLWIIFYLLN